MKNPGLYILTSPRGKKYVGRDVNLPKRAKKHLIGNSSECRAIYDAIKKYGADTFSVEIIRYPGISHEALNAVERWKIKQLQTLAPKGYNLTDGGDSSKPSEETRQKLSKKTRKRLEDGTHPFLGGEMQRHNARKQLEAGTHNFLDEKHSIHKQFADGTHPFLGGEMQRKRVADGTHPFLGGEISRRTQKKRLEDGTHNFIGENHPIKRLSKEGRHPSTLKRQKAEWCYIVALSRFWYEIHDYTLKRRAEFLSKDIPDTSNAEQEYLF